MLQDEGCVAACLDDGILPVMREVLMQAQNVALGGLVAQVARQLCLTMRQHAGPSCSLRCVGDYVAEWGQAGSV